MAIDTADNMRSEIKRMAKELGKQVEDALMGDPDPSEERIKDVFETALAVRDTTLDRLYNPNSSHNDIIENKMDRLAAEGIYIWEINKAKTKILRWRIERKAKSCASGLMEAKRTEHEGIEMRGKVFDECFGEYKRYCEKVMPEDVNLGLSYGRRIMDKAEEEVKGSWKVDEVKKE